MSACFRPKDWRGYLANVPPFPGKLRAINGAAVLVRWFRGGDRTVELWPDAPFYVNLQDRIQRQMWMGCYENHVTRCAAALVCPGDTFLDIGAHIGYHSYFVAGLVGSTGFVFSFEPDPVLFTHLTRNLSSFSWTRTVNAAVWSSNSPDLLFERSFSSSESGWGALTTVRDLHLGEHILVRSFALDSWMDTVRLNSLKLIKLDAEGAELASISGGLSTLNRFRPSLLLEINATILRQSGSSAAVLLETLASLQYEVYSLEFSSMSKLSGLADDESADCVALPKERVEDSLNALKARGFEL